MEPTVTTLRNLTAYGINGTKYVRRVLVGHRKIHLNRASNGKELTINMTPVFDQVRRNDILTKIPDRLASFTDEIRPFDGKGSKVQDGRSEENPIKVDLEKETQMENKLVQQQEDGGLEIATFSEDAKRMGTQDMKGPTSPSLPLATTQIQPSLVPSETQDQLTNRRPTQSKDRFRYKYPGRPKLPGSSTLLINSRQPTPSMASIISLQLPEKKHSVGNVLSVPSSSSFAVEKRKTTASQESKPDDQGLLTESVQGLNRDPSIANLPKGTTDAKITTGDTFPKQETINKTAPLYHRMSHRGTFPRRPNIGPFQNRSSTHQHSNRNPLHRPILNRPKVNSTAGNKMESGTISNRQSILNPNQTPTLTWQGKNGTAIRFPPKHPSQIKPNLKNVLGSKAGVTVDQKTQKNSDITVPGANIADHKFNLSLSTVNALSKSNDTIQPVNGGSGNFIDHLPRVTNRDNNTTWQTIRNHQRVPGVIRQNDPNLKIRPPFILKRKNNTIIRPPLKFNTQVNANSTTIHTPLTDNKYETKRKDSKDASRESKIVLATDSDTNLFANISMLTEETPTGTNETLQLISEDSENTLNNPNKDYTMPRVTNRDHKLPKVTTRDPNLPRVKNRDSNITMQMHINQKVGPGIRKDGTSVRFQPTKPISTSIHGGLNDPDIKVVKGAKEPTVTLSTDTHTVESDHKLQDFAEGSGVDNDDILSRITNQDKGTTANQRVPYEITSSNENIRITNRDNGTTMQIKPKINSHGQNGVTMRKKNGTVLKNTLKSNIRPNLHGDRNRIQENSTTRHAIPHYTSHRNPNFTQRRKNGTIIRLPPKVFPHLRPNTSTIHDDTKRSKSFTDDPKIGQSTQDSLLTDGATSQTNTTFPVSEIPKNGISQVGVQNVTSKGYIIFWTAPKEKFKNFVIKIIEEKDEGLNEGDDSNREDGKERKKESKITSNAIEFVRRNNSEDVVKKQFIKLLPGSTRSYAVTDLTPQTGYSVTLYGTGPGLRSNVHTFVITTGTQNLKGTKHCQTIHNQQCSS